MRQFSFLTAIILLFSSALFGFKAFGSDLLVALQGSDLPQYDSAPGSPDTGDNPTVDPTYRGGTWDDTSLAGLLDLQGVEASGSDLPEAPYVDRLTSDGGKSGGSGSGDPGSTSGGTSSGGTGSTSGGSTSGGTTGGGTSGGGTGSPPTSGNGGALPGEAFGPGGGSGHAPGVVNTHTGNRITTVPIVAWHGVGGMAVDFSLIHNSQVDGAAGNGLKWRTTFDTTVYQDSSMAPTGSPKSAVVRMADGTPIPFRETTTGSQIYTAPTSGYKWILTRKPYGETYGWRLRFDDQSCYFFDDYGYLLEVRDRNAHSVFVARPSGHRMTMVYDSSRVLSFTRRTDGRIDTATDSLGRSWSFTYDTSNRLTGVTYPALSGLTYTRTFNYNTRNDITSEVDQRGKTWLCTYDGSDRLTSWTDPTSRTCAYTYGASYTSFTLPHDSTATIPYLKVTHNYSSGMLASEVDPAGYSVGYGWDTSKNATRVTDENGHSTLFTYDSNGNPLTVQRPHLSVPGSYTTVLTSTYNSSNDLLTETDALGHILTYGYDTGGHGNLLTVSYQPSTLAGSSVLSTLTRDGNAQVTNAGSIDATATDFAYDTSGNVTTVTPGGAVLGTTITYDAMGRPTSVARYGRGTSTVTYDEWGRVAVATHSDSTTASATYNLEGEPITETDENGHTCTVTYDDAGRPLSATNARGDTGSVTYDSYGRVVAVTNGRGKTRTFVLTPRGERSKMTLPDGYTEEYTYDPAGNLKVYRDARMRGLSQTTIYAYDKWDRLTTTTYASGGTSTMAYDLIDEPTSLTDSSGTTTWSWDNCQRIDHLTTPLGTVQYTYDTQWRRHTMQQPGVSGSTTYGYDAYGRLSSLTNPYSETTSWTFDTITGDLTKQTFSTGAYSSYAFDIRGRVSSIGHYTSGGSALWTESYGYDGASNLTSKTTPYDSITYTYDQIGQLLSESGPSSGYIAYTYDGNGNRLTRIIGGATESYSYDDGDKLTSISVGGTTTRSYSYDLAGRPTSITTSAGTRTLAYDDDDNLTSISGTGGGSYTYNAAGTRVKKVVGSSTTNYVRDGAGVTAPVISDGSAVYTPGISERRGSTSSFALSDRMGSATNLANSSSAVTDTKDLDAFGNLRGSTGSNPTPFGYAGGFGYQGDETGLMLLGHRYYDPSAGRFLTRDPAEDGANWFAYCRNSPLSFCDPAGLAVRTSQSGAPSLLCPGPPDDPAVNGPITWQDVGDFFEDGLEGCGDFFGNQLCPAVPVPDGHGGLKLVPFMTSVRMSLGCDGQIRYDSGGYACGQEIGGLMMGEMGGGLMSTAEACPIPTICADAEEAAAPGQPEACAYGNKMHKELEQPYRDLNDPDIRVEKRLPSGRRPDLHQPSEEGLGEFKKRTCNPTRTFWQVSDYVDETGHTNVTIIHYD